MDVYLDTKKVCKDIEEVCDDIDNIIKRNEKLEKILKIIKEKLVLVKLLQMVGDDLQKYNYYIGDKKRYLTQEEFDLLKGEIL
jgi:hypothetical protein